MPLGLLEKKGLRHLITEYCGSTKRCSRRSLTRELKLLYEEKKSDLSRRLKKMLEVSVSYDQSPAENKVARFRSVEQDIWTLRSRSFQGIVMQQIGKSIIVSFYLTSALSLPLDLFLFFPTDTSSRSRWEIITEVLAGFFFLIITEEDGGKFESFSST